MGCGCGKKKPKVVATKRGTTRPSQMNKLIPKEAKNATKT